MKSICQLISLLYIISISTPINAQYVNTLVLESPVSIAGDYEIFRGEFGAQIQTAFSEEIIFAKDNQAPFGDACEMMNNVDGKVALIEDENCDLAFKALLAEESGAVGVIICLDLMELVKPVGSKLYVDDVSIPVFGISKTHCDNFLIEIADTSITADFYFECRSPNYGEHILWGNQQGQGDFFGGLNDWTVDCQGDSCWIWRDDGHAFGVFTDHLIKSTTACNGAMVFSSDYLNNGIQIPLPDPLISICETPCTGALISPNIDLTNIANFESFALRFDQSYRHFLSEYYLLISTDDGLTWPDTIGLNLKTETNGPYIDGVVTLPLKEYVDADQIKFQFYHVGDYYFWTIDDVRLIEWNDLADCQIDCENFSAPPVWKSPFTQVFHFPLGAEILNQGLNDATGISLHVQLSNEAGEVIFTEQNEFPDLAAGEKQELVAFDFDFPTSLPPGLYEGCYEVQSDIDFDNTNNGISFSFISSEDTYANCPNQEEMNQLMLWNYDNFPRDMIEEDSLDFSSYRIGTIFRSSINGFEVRSLKFRIGQDSNPLSGFYDMYIYELTETSHLDYVISESEITFVNKQSIVLDTIADPGLVEFILSYDSPFSTMDEEVFLKGNTNYLILLECKSINDYPLPLAALPLDGFNGIPLKNWNTTGTQTLLNLESDMVAVGSYFAAMESYDDGWRNLKFNPTFLPFIEMKISSTSSSNDIHIASNNIHLSPNPTTGKFQIYTDSKEENFVSVQLIDLNGSIVYQEEQRLSPNGSIDVAIDELPSGTYIALIEGKSLKASKKLMLVK